MRQRNGDSSNRAVLQYKIKNELIADLKHRFSLYGYQEVHSPTFEDYDLYASIRKTVNKDDMIKVIDRTGKVLVLRPDGTIPITRLTATDPGINDSEQRLFYVFNVYREAEKGKKETTQAGVELFGNKRPEADAEIISLAVETLKEIGFENFAIEIGHAGFFKELIGKADLTADDLQQLKELIQTKNIVEIEPFLEKLPLSAELQNALQTIPLLYGAPKTVLEETKSIIRNENMQQIFNNMMHVMDVLEDYGVLGDITLNLGLINHMDYYTDVIFQGFVENIGKPVLMGGRYDDLAEHFGKRMPAIGFAYEVDFLLEAMKRHQLTATNPIQAPLALHYSEGRRRDAFAAAEMLRQRGYPVVTMLTDEQKEKSGIWLSENRNLFSYGKTKSFHTSEDLMELIDETFGGG